MVTESADAPGFKIRLLVFVILHNSIFMNSISPSILILSKWFFSVINGKMLSDHVPEKIFKIGQVVQNL